MCVCRHQTTMSTRQASDPTMAPAPSSSDGGKQQHHQVVTRIAPPSASEKLNERNAVRCRTRRERPQKLRIAEEECEEDGSTDAATTPTQQRNLYQPDVESFVSACIPGVSIAPVDGDSTQQEMVLPSQRRTKSIRKRSLPLISFLSTTHLAAAEKKRKKEEQDRLKAIAEEEAKKALLLNPIVKPAILGNGPTNNVGNKPPSFIDQGVRLETSANASESTKKTETTPEAPTVTTTIENTSNILMPPLLRDFLKHPKFKPM